MPQKPKEKAEELFKLFAEKLFPTSLRDKDNKETAKKCAIVCVNEIIAEYEQLDENTDFPFDYSGFLTFFDSVKKELEIL